MVRVLKFTDGEQWIARLRMPGLNSTSLNTTCGRIISEHFTLSIVKSATNIPVPHVHTMEPHYANPVKAPFMLMECLEGNVGMELGMDVPSQHKQAFYNDLAKIHVSSTVLSVRTC